MPDKTEFFSQGARLRAEVWRPARSPAPAVIVTGSWTTVKEQMPAKYAPLLADAGFVAMTFDFGGFGESEGGPREVESPRRKSEDIRNAVAFLRTMPASMLNALERFRSVRAPGTWPRPCWTSHR